MARAYDEDPLVHRLRCVRWGAETLEVIEWIKARPGEIGLPVLFLHGEGDRLVRASGAEHFCAGIDYPDKAIRMASALYTPLVLSFATPDVLGALLSIGGPGFLGGSLTMSAWGGPRRRVYGLLGASLLSRHCAAVHRAGARRHAGHDGGVAPSTHP